MEPGLQLSETCLDCSEILERRLDLFVESAAIPFRQILIPNLFKVVVKLVNVPIGIALHIICVIVMSLGIVPLELSPSIKASPT
jgi:hypothetical protein